MSWYHIPGNEQDVAVCTRVSLARNLVGVPFPSRLDAAGARELIGRVGTILEKNGFLRTDFSDISSTSAQSLVEKKFISPYFARESLPHALFLNDPCNLAVMVCERNHIRMQCIQPGLSLQDAAEGVVKVEALLDSRLSFAFDSRWGYLTASPEDLGTGMVASVILSLPLLSCADRMEALGHHLSQMGLCLHGVSRGIAPNSGHLYRVSNRVTLGVSEEGIIQLLDGAVKRIMEAERSAREHISGEELDRLTDRITRAEGVLRHARLLSGEEMTEHLGLLRIGAAMGIISGIRVETLTELLCEAMPASISLGAEPLPKSETDREILRAKMVRERVFGV